MPQMFETLKEILVGKLKVEPDQVTPEATREDVELDSLAVVELSLVIEKELGVAVSDDELLDADTIGAMALLVEQRMSTI
ncbi:MULTISPECIES: acyl carrier protein [Streptomyces]|uniref:acyl carrier protein n=1 Tax=Streptomyces TaxID=1883 RepID=UPI0024A56661|nr:acyl carrier protein [Streptomyces sp. WAC07149]GLX17141.1 acyl carrier protein [Streptomyces lavendulae subsp. lavendulae]GLX29649.1 acyl carrier protein [Streptomyces lavendulae subsp. lavendulae]